MVVHTLEVTYVASIEIILKSRVLVTVNVEWGIDTSRMVGADSIRRHSPMKPIADGSTSPFTLFLGGGNFTFRLPFI